MKKLAIEKNDIMDVVKATVLAVIASLILVLALALLVNLLEISESIIMPVNQVIKLISILFGCFSGIKNKRQGVFKGALIGLLYTFLSIFIFGIISHAVSFSSMNLIDIALGIVAGSIAGILSVNLRKK